MAKEGGKDKDPSQELCSKDVISHKKKKKKKGMLFLTMTRLLHQVQTCISTRFGLRHFFRERPRFARVKIADFIDLPLQG